MVGDDDEGFGDFKFAPSSTTVRFDPPMMNAHDSSANYNDDDDDWGDFVIPGGLSHAVSLPRFLLHTDQKLENEDSDLMHPGSAPGRASGMAQWKKPAGALPLSIFGAMEEERKSSAGDPSFHDGFSRIEIDSVKKVSGPNVNDLIANLLKQSDVVPNVHMSNSDDKLNKNDVNMNELKLDALELNSSSRVPDFSLNWVNSDTNGKHELTLDALGLNLDWDPPKLNSNGSNSNKDIIMEGVSIANRDKLGSIGGNETFHHHDDDDDDGDDGWEFKDAQASIVDEEISKMNQIKTQNGPVVNGLNSTWNSFCLDPNGWNSNFGIVSSSTHFSGPGLVEQAREHASAADDDDNDDGWEFKVADSQTQLGDDKIRTENGPASILSLDRRTSSDLNGVNLNMKQVNLNLFDKNEDFWSNDGWEYKAAGSIHGPGDENTKDAGKMPKDFESTIDTFGCSNEVHGPGDLFGALQGTSHKLVESNSDFAFSSNKSEQNHNDNKKLDSVENSWSSNNAFPEAVRKDEGDKVELDNNKRALPLSIFGDEEEEDDNPVIHQDSSTSITSSNLKNAIKNHQIDINDLISSLYSQAVPNTSVNHEEALSGGGLDSTKNGGSSLGSDNHDFDDNTWEFQDASLGAGENGFAPVKEYSNKTEQDDYVEFFSRLREEVHYTALYHLENLKKSQSVAALTDNGAKTQYLDKEIQDLESDLQDSIISAAICSESCSPREISLSVFVEALMEPKFQVFGSEYQLAEKVSRAGSDWRSAIDVLKCVALIVNILTSASREEQSNYISAWSKMLSVCVQELRHGTSVWKQAVQQNFQEQILSRPQGKNYILALGEVYRVAKVLESSAKLYKPWILASSADSVHIFTLLTDCLSLWSSSGLEEALHSSLSSADFEYNGSVKTLLESIKYIDGLDVESLYDHVFSGQSPPCQLSALTADLVPGMKIVAWNGNHCFLTLANLWANMVSSEPPNWPCIHVG